MAADGGPGRRASRSAQRRERERGERLSTILKAAEAFFADEGYHQTSMERIADEAEVAVGTLYFYFKNKEDLLRTMLDTIGFELRELLGQAFREAEDPEDGLRRASRAFFQGFCARSPARLAIIFRESVGQSVAVEEHRKELFKKVLEDLAAALERLAAAQGVTFRSEHSLGVAAASILGTYERLAVHYLIWGEAPDRAAALEAVADDAVEFIIGGIRGLIVR